MSAPNENNIEQLIQLLQKKDHEINQVRYDN